MPVPASSPLSGAAYLLSGFSLIVRKGVRRWVILPLLINILLFGALIAYSFNLMRSWIAHFNSWLPGWLSWLEWLLWPLFVLSLALILFFSFSLVAGFIAAPFNGPLAAAVERHLTGIEPPGDGSSGWVGLVLVPLGEELRKLWYNLWRLIPLLLLFLVPGVQLLAPILLFLFSAWLLALQYLDYPMSNHGLRFDEMRAYLRQRRWLSLGFGAATLGMTLIPGLNLLVMPVAVAGATQLWVKEFKPLHDA